MKRPHQVPAASRERLLRSARKLFSERGYAAASTRAIAAAAGCNVALIHHYYGSKEGLLRQAVLEGFRAVREKLESLQIEPAPAADRVRAFIGFMVGHFDRHRETMRILERELMGHHTLLLEARKRAEANVRLLATLLGQARAEQSLRREVEPAMAAVLLMGMLKFYFVSYPVSSRVVGKATPQTLAALERHIAEIFLRGVLP